MRLKNADDVDWHLHKVENHPEQREAKDHVSCCHCNVHLQSSLSIPSSTAAVFSKKIFLSPVLYILRRCPSWKAWPPYSCELTLSKLGWLLYIIDQKWNCVWKNLFYLTGTKSPKPMVESVMKQKYMPLIVYLGNVKCVCL